MSVELCHVCCGKPLESGRTCICGGKGTHAEEVVGLRTELHAARERIEKLEKDVAHERLNTNQHKVHYEGRIEALQKKLKDAEKRVEAYAKDDPAKRVILNLEVRTRLAFCGDTSRRTCDKKDSRGAFKCSMITSTGRVCGDQGRIDLAVRVVSIPTHSSVGRLRSMAEAPGVRDAQSVDRGP
jgi:hypothetical protein